MAQNILSITQINEYIRSSLDSDPLLSGVALRGEISNYKLYPSGHHYFTLKDDSACLKCVMFRNSAYKLRFRPENGMKVIALGKISVYPRDGAYQLYCSAMTPDGVGDLHTAFEQLKAKLSSQGLFDSEHKKPIPRFPKVIGIVTSSAGAALHDMLRILGKRYPLCKVILLPVRVQGVEAPAEICNAIDFANKFQLADLLIVGRGGGSLEDLWAFNDEGVAHAIYRSEIPVISAVGHEPDVTISDYVADLRAATPSNAAELAVPDQEALRQCMDQYLLSMASSLQRQLKAHRMHLDTLSGSASLQSPYGYIEQRRRILIAMRDRLASASAALLDMFRRRYIASTSKLDAMSPLKVLARGYSVVQNQSREVLNSVLKVNPGDQISIELSDGQLGAYVTEIKENL